LLKFKSVQDVREVLKKDFFINGIHEQKKDRDYDINMNSGMIRHLIYKSRNEQKVLNAKATQEKESITKQ
jgi:hypothetical protein